MKFFEPLPPTIFVDMDGVIAAWTETVFAMFGKPMPEVLPYMVHGSLGLTEDEMWEHINRFGISWWENLPAYPWARDLWSRLESLGVEMRICTSPDYSGNSPSGKVWWLQKQFGKDFRRYVITPDKYLVAHPRAVLVDDSEEKLAPFAKHGGLAVLFPRRWNSGGERKPEAIVDEVVSNVRAALLRAGVPV